MNEAKVVILARRIFASNHECMHFSEADIFSYDPETIKNAKITANKLVVVLRMKFPDLDPNRYLYNHNKETAKLSMEDIYNMLKNERINEDR